MNKPHTPNVPQNYDLTGRVALITGCGGLLGPIHAEALLECGATVVVTDIEEQKIDRTVERLSEKYNTDQLLGRRMDVANYSSVKNVFQSILDQVNAVHILINNAALDPKVGSMGGDTSRFEYFPLKDWDDQVRVGLTGTFICSQVFGTAMAANGDGVIINIASDLSVIAPDQRIYQNSHPNKDEHPVKPVAYSVVKTGVIGLTRYLATYWANRGVRVNALSPGGVYADQPKCFVDKVESLIPMGRMAEKDEYVGAIQFLCSDASRYMTGQNLVIDGGRSVW